MSNLTWCEFRPKEFAFLRYTQNWECDQLGFVFRKINMLNQVTDMWELLRIRRMLHAIVCKNFLRKQKF